MSDVTDPTSTQPTVQAYNTTDAQSTTDFSNMSVEDIMFVVLTDAAKSQKANIETFAASIQANTLKATNLNNLKAAIDNGASSSDGAKPTDMSTTWENADGSTESISMAEAYSRLGMTPTASDSATTAVADQQVVDSDQKVVDGDQAVADADIDSSTGLSDSRKTMAHEEVGHDDAGYTFAGKDAATSLSSIQEDTGPSGQNAYDNDYIRPQDAQVGADIDNYEADSATLQTDTATANSDAGNKISQSDLNEMSANLATAHDDIDGKNQIDMAKLQKDMDDYQTTLQTVQSSTDSMARLSQKIGGSVGGG